MGSQKSQNSSQKFLLCRPHGGLNDVFCQIEKCWEYAEKFERILIIDTTLSGLHTKFSEFFEPRHKTDKVFFELGENQLAFLNGTSCFPPELFQKLDNYEAEAADEIHNLVVKNTKVPLTFDFSRAYDEMLLVHEQWGGGNLSFDLVPRLKISQEIRSIILRRISGLNRKYVAIHVRNTDYQTDYMEFFSRIRSRIGHNPLLVCSDDVQVIKYAQTFFTASILLFSRELLDTEGKPLHHRNTFSNQEERRQIIIDTIVDLVGLARAHRLYFTNVSSGHTSGFSRLAQYLRKNKALIGSLLGIPMPQTVILRWCIKSWVRRLRRGFFDILLLRF
jgi:hypothetical protein